MGLLHLADTRKRSFVRKWPKPRTCARYAPLSSPPGVCQSYSPRMYCQMLQVCLLDLDYNLPVQVRDSATGKELEDLPESDVNKEYVLQRLAEDGDLDSSYNKQRADDTILKLQRTTPYYKVCPVDILVQVHPTTPSRMPSRFVQHIASIFVCCRGTGLQSAVSLSRENASVVLNAHIDMKCQALASLQSRTSKTGRYCSTLWSCLVLCWTLCWAVTVHVYSSAVLSMLVTLQVLWSE